MFLPGPSCFCERDTSARIRQVRTDRRTGQICLSREHDRDGSSAAYSTGHVAGPLPSPLCRKQAGGVGFCCLLPLRKGTEGRKEIMSLRSFGSRRDWRACKEAVDSCSHSTCSTGREVCLAQLVCP